MASSKRHTTHHASLPRMVTGSTGTGLQNSWASSRSQRWQNGPQAGVRTCCLVSPANHLARKPKWRFSSHQYIVKTEINQKFSSVRNILGNTVNAIINIPSIFLFFENCAKWTLSEYVFVAPKQKYFQITSEAVKRSNKLRFWISGNSINEEN